MKSYDVKFWAIRPGKAKTKRTYEVRWKVGHSPQSRTLGNKAQADNFLSELRQAARKGEAFDTETGLPDSLMTTASRERSWLTFCLAYTDMKWPSAAPKTRDSLTDALATLIPALTSEPAPDGIDTATLRTALRHFALAPASRALDRPPAIAAALCWLEKTSLPVSIVSKPQHARAALDAISVQQNGTAASATTIARKRSVFANVIRYAAEKEEMPSNPLDRLSWKPPKVSEVVDRRVVVNPRQARELLTAVTYVGQQRRGPHARGQRLMAFYACMYFAALRPAEVVGLRRQDCHLSATGWGRLTLKSPGPRSTGAGPTATPHTTNAASSTGPPARHAAYPSRPNWPPSSAPTSPPSASRPTAGSSAATAATPSPPPLSAMYGPKLAPSH